MVPVAFVLEFFFFFFFVGKIAQKLAFTVMNTTDRPQFITCHFYSHLLHYVSDHEPVATILFKDQHTFGTWIQTWAMNFLIAICWQMFYCGDRW